MKFTTYETDNLEIEEGKQYCTLLTCTPYGVNSHRLLVRGHYKENIISTDIASEAKVVDSNIMIIIISIPLIILLFIIMIALRNKRRVKDLKDEEIKNFK